MTPTARARRFVRAPRPLAGRGFTLIELMVVVVLIAIMAAIAVPGVVQRLRERRVSEAAERIAALYRNARMRALGRGGAVLVRYEDSRFYVFESVQGTAAVDNAACANMPSASCLRANWANSGANTRREIGGFRYADRPEYTDANVTVAVSAPSGSVSQLDVCFNPSGQSFTRTDFAGTFTSLTGVVTANVIRSANIGLRRTVTVLPNGVATVSGTNAP